MSLSSKNYFADLAGSTPEESRAGLNSFLKRLPGRELFFFLLFLSTTSLLHAAVVFFQARFFWTKNKQIMYSGQVGFFEIFGKKFN
jgi:hypothetical protein